MVAKLVGQPKLQYLDIQVDPELGTAEPLGGVGVEADDVFARGVGGECELALTAVHLGEDDLVVRVTDLHVHPNLGAAGGEPVSPRIVQLQKHKSVKATQTNIVLKANLNFVVAGDHRLVRDFLDEALALRLPDVEVEAEGERGHQEADQHPGQHGRAAMRDTC